MITKKGVTVGNDPEVFFRDRTGKFIPAIGLVGGSKHNPKQVGIGYVQEDNVMAEFNIQPASSAEEFDKHTEAMLKEIESIAAKNNLSVAITPWAEFEPPYLKHPQAMHIGCDPDVNAWTRDYNESPSIEKLQNIRTASGHVHIGVTNPNLYPSYRIDLVKSLDLYLGIPSVFFDTDTFRRNFYGKAGAYRPKPYGVEYRVLSNFWIASSTLRKWVFNQTLSAVYNIENAKLYLKKGALTPKIIQDVINNGDIAEAKKLVAKFSLMLDSPF